MTSSKYAKTHPLYSYYHFLLGNKNYHLSMRFPGVFNMKKRLAAIIVDDVVTLYDAKNQRSVDFDLNSLRRSYRVSLYDINENGAYLHDSKTHDMFHIDWNGVLIQDPYMLSLIQTNGYGLYYSFSRPTTSDIDTELFIHCYDLGSRNTISKRLFIQYMTLGLGCHSFILPVHGLYGFVTSLKLHIPHLNRFGALDRMETKDGVGVFVYDANNNTASLYFTNISGPLIRLAVLRDGVFFLVLQSDIESSYMVFFGADKRLSWLCLNDLPLNLQDPALWVSLHMVYDCYHSSDNDVVISDFDVGTPAIVGKEWFRELAFLNVGTSQFLCFKTEFRKNSARGYVGYTPVSGISRNAHKLPVVSVLIEDVKYIPIERSAVWEERKWYF